MTRAGVFCLAALAVASPHLPADFMFRVACAVATLAAFYAAGDK
jgi:hypothetical protein